MYDVHVHVNVNVFQYIRLEMHIGTLIVVLEMVCCWLDTKSYVKWKFVANEKRFRFGIYFYYAFNIHRQSMAWHGIILQNAHIRIAQISIDAFTV